MRRSLIAPVALALVSACTADAPPPVMEEDSLELRPRSDPIEFVGMRITRPLDIQTSEFEDLIDRIFGRTAGAGDRHQNLELQPGLYLSVADDPRTADQIVIQMDMIPPGTGERRTVLRVPASFAYGAIVQDTVEAALARTRTVVSTDPTGMSDWHLEYSVISANGGKLSLELDYEAHQASYTIATENPRTSLMQGGINSPAYAGDPYEVIGGTVLFSLSRDEFGFFSNRAYGTSAGAQQNFDDFQLQPHQWLRLTITPMVEDGMVDVAFEVVTVDGRRHLVARAPASYLAGEQFQQNVFRLVDNMNAQEAANPGSSTDFVAPFHYDDPEGGGVVKVIAFGDNGQFKIAYSILSPTHRLKEVDFVPYVADLDLQAAAPRQSCTELGTLPSDNGVFLGRFEASSTVRDSMELTDPLMGPVWGSVFRDEDVTIAGPKPGTQAVMSFHFPMVDVRNGPSMEFDFLNQLPAGEYQILGFMDIDGNADPMDADPDEGDPVMIPIGAYTLECAVQPVNVEFAILLPPGY